ncbi:MAG: DUF4236 domain-containing protein [Lachnospiraceae bacterium]|nr:DUF4236 domain-containing protein [Lachnospiraceae bacterium]
MGLRYRKSITIFPGVKLNISKSGLSLSVGKKGAHVSAGTSGRKSVSVGVPGTGLSYTKTISGGSKKKSLGIVFTVVVITVAVIMGILKYKDKIAGFFGASADSKTAVETTVDTDAGSAGNTGNAGDAAATTYVINTSTKKFHLSSCRYATGDNVKTVNKSKSDLINEGYEACKTCKP